MDAAAAAAADDAAVTDAAVEERDEAAAASAADDAVAAGGETAADGADGAAGAAAAAANAAPRLADLDMFPVVDAQGLVNPLAPPGARAHVFAVFDSKRHLQYVGFSGGLRASLRRLLGRRPDKAFFFK